MLSVFQDTAFPAKSKHFIRAVFDPYFKKTKVDIKVNFSPLIINDVMLKPGKMSDAAAIARNFGFSLNRNSKLNNFCKHGT